jgi:putative oxidoreductase
MMDRPGIARSLACFDPVGRLLLASLYLVSGFNHLTHWQATLEEMRAHGMLAAPLWLSADVLVELGGSIGLVVGFWPRASALALAAFTVTATSIWHHDFSDPGQLRTFIKDMALFGALLCLAARGAGPYSIGRQKRAGRT